VDPAKLFSDNLPLIRRIAAAVARSHRLSPADVEDFVSKFQLHLIDGDHAVLRTFEGRCQLATFLTVVAKRLCIDEIIHERGKWRPSASARRAGPLAELLERLLHFDGRSFDEAYQILKMNYRVPEGRKEIEALLAEIPERTVREIRPIEEDVHEVPSPAPGPDVVVGVREDEDYADRVEEIVGRILREMAPEDRLIVELQFRDGQTLAAISRLLGVEQRPLYRQVRRILIDLRHRLEAEGVEAERVRRLLGRCSKSFDLFQVPQVEPGKTTGTGPSHPSDGGAVAHAGEE